MKSYMVTTKMVVKHQIQAESSIEAMDMIYNEFHEVFEESGPNGVEQSAEEVQENE